MTNGDSARRTQAAFFCVELHGHVGDLDGQAAMVAAKLRALAEPGGRPGAAGATRALKDKLYQLTVERKRVMDLLAKIGHDYPCRHEAP